MEKIKILLEHILAERIVEDMNYILDKGWADRVDSSDLGHGHVCVYDNSHQDRLARYQCKPGVLIRPFRDERQLSS